MASPPTKVHCITRGDRFEFRVTLTRPNGSPFDLVVEDLTLPKMELRVSPSDLTPVATFTATVVGATNNVVVLVLDATETLVIPATSYRARLLLQHTSVPALDQITRTHYTFNVEESATRR